MTDDDLEQLAGELRDAPRLPDTPAGLRERTLAAVAAALELDGIAAPEQRRRLPVLIGAAALALAIAVGVVATGGGDDGPRGELELRARLTGTSDASADIEVREIGEGRTVRVDSDDLAVLPKGEYYEVWFVGPDDAPGSPQRISAGTFHPDPQGRTHITLFGAVDPEKLPKVEVTAEPEDGDPRPSDVVVLTNQ